MGGALVLIAITFSTLLWADLSNRYIWVVLLVTLGFGAIGWRDDYLKLVLKHSRGLSARHKYFMQSVLGLAAACYLYFNAATPAETDLIFPFFKNVVLPLGPFFIFISIFCDCGFQ